MNAPTLCVLRPPRQHFIRADRAQCHRNEKPGAVHVFLRRTVYLDDRQLPFPVTTAAPAIPRPLAPTSHRVGAAIVAAACLALLAVAAWLTPAPEGHGTHEQLGLPPCGWLVATGRPCPTCGMTTAFALAADGDLAGSFAAHPFGAVLALGTAAAFWISLHVAIFGSRAGYLAGRLLQPRPLWLAAGAWGAGWAYKIATWPVQ